VTAFARYLRPGTIFSRIVNSNKLKHSYNSLLMEKSDRLKSFSINSFAVKISSDLNRIHSTFTSMNVIAHCVTFPSLSQNLLNNRFRQLNKPWSTPHNINVQFAPCQIPLAR